MPAPHFRATVTSPGAVQHPQDCIDRSVCAQNCLGGIEKSIFVCAFLQFLWEEPVPVGRERKKSVFHPQTSAKKQVELSQGTPSKPTALGKQNSKSLCPCPSHSRSEGRSDPGPGCRTGDPHTAPAVVTAPPQSRERVLGGSRRPQGGARVRAGSARELQHSAGTRWPC